MWNAFDDICAAHLSWVVTLRSPHLCPASTATLSTRFPRSSSLLFALVDPSDLHWFGNPLELSRSAIYTLAFFVFRGITMASSALTTLLAQSPFEVNRCPLPLDERPVDCARGGSCC